MLCPVCGYSNAAAATQCQACGTQLVAEPKPAARAGDAVCANHPEQPALQPCARCGTFYCAACLERAADNQLYCANCRARSGLPWDQREELGLLRAWFQTCTRLMLEPTQTLAVTPRDGSIASSLLFTALCACAGVITTLMLCIPAYGRIIYMALDAAKKTGEGSGAPALGLGLVGGAAIFIVYFGMAVGGQVVSLFVLGALEHLILKLLGEREVGEYTVTVRAHALGLAPFVIGLIPFCGPMVMGLWSLVLRCITLMHLQRVSAGKAVAAILGPVVILCGCLGLGYVVIIAAAVGASGLSR
ncbi:MAG: YIP1 family protein [Archangiaceae bacterium]|nr:YIP1 family protein [Archangiaceae bacterium]